MMIFLNNEPIKLPEEVMTVEDLLKWKNISTRGTAVAINDIIVRKDKWGFERLTGNCRVTIISAAFGG